MKLPKFPPELDAWKPGTPFKEMPLPKWARNNPGDSSSNPTLLVNRRPVDAAVEGLRAAKRAEWEAKDYRPGLIEKGLLWAEEWVEGLLKSPLYASLSQEAREKMAVELYKVALDRAEPWVKAFMES